MDSPGAFPESPMEVEDVVYTCKGCGEILEEGKAFELAGNRWHIDCFRCNTCGTLLDSDANLLLLGDGSLICNNCTYSCNACGNKIEDLAILTGDQAFCANCFRCRNCKRKIDNLRYARTSQGIFCMSCHESLMARRRKKSRAAAAAAAAQAQQKLGGSQSPMLLDKSLPSLPPTVGGADVSSLDRETTPPSDTFTDTPTELSPRPRPPNSRQTSSQTSQSRKRERSPLTLAPEETKKDSLNLPSTTYRHNRESTTSQHSDVSGNGDTFNIPLLLDTGSGHDRSPPSQRHTPDPRRGDTERTHSKPPESRASERDYFSPVRAPATNGRPRIQRHISSPVTSHDADSRHDASSKTGTPHIAFQERGRQPSSELTDVLRNKEKNRLEHPPRSSSATEESVARSKSDDAPPAVQQARPSKPTANGRPVPSQGDQFKLQEVPKGKKSGGSQRSSKSDTQSPLMQRPSPTALSRSVSASELDPPSPESERAEVTIPSSDSTKSLEPSKSSESPRGSSDSRPQEDPSTSPTQTSSSFVASHILHKPKREDSLQFAKGRQQASARKESAGESTTKSPASSPQSQEFTSSPSSATAGQDSQSDAPSLNGAQPSSKVAPESFPLPGGDASLTAQARAAYTKATMGESFTSPRAPPQPPATSAESPVHPTQPTIPESAEMTQNDPTGASTGLPRHSLGGEFTMDDDMARILGGTDERSTSLFRRVSNVVRHGRSLSDMEARSRGSAGKWPRSPASAGLHSSFPRDISSPTTASPVAMEENVVLKHELRRSAQKIADLEARVNSTADIKTLDTKLREKRSTVAFLDTQKEIMVRELEVLTEHVADVKKNEEPFDIDTLTQTVVKEFARSLERLKDSYGPEIEDLIETKNGLTEENANLARLRDQAIQETEQLNLKNAQLADLNNELTHQIQERYKANRDGTTYDPIRPAANGLGIYSHHQKEKSDLSMDGREIRPGTSQGPPSLNASSTLVEQNEAEPATVLTAPHVVNIRKGQVKKFNWKKGGQTVAKGVSKGLKGAFSSNQPYQYQYQREGSTAEGMPAPMPTVESPNGTISRPVLDATKKEGLGFFGQRLGKGPQYKFPSNGEIVPAASPSTLFGSELGERADYERRQIPSVVTRCIEEVELRGMDIEGIYRKTGGNSQVRAIQEGFERMNDYDISDPALDITAVTSVLKQYFRKLPNPLMTFEAYDRILDTNSIEDDEKRIVAMRVTIQALPPKHHDCLEFLIFHLARVATREKENLMTPKNLAVVFAPTIMRDTSLEREMSDMHSKNNAIQFLVENYKSVFPGA